MSRYGHFDEARNSIFIAEIYSLTLDLEILEIYSFESLQAFSPQLAAKVLFKIESPLITRSLAAR
jgi:hypothetical protein